MSILSQDTRFPIVGNVVTMTAEQVPSNHRVRWRVRSAPITSAVQVYDVTKDNWLADGKLAADADGVFELEAVEERYAGAAPHFSNDGGLGLNVGVDTWEVESVTPYSVTVGRKLRRTIGLSPDTCTLEAFALGIYPDDGFLTARYDSLLAPRLVEPSTERAKLALASAALQAQLVSMGGSGYTGPLNLLPGETVFHANPQTVIGRLISAFNAHILAETNGVHGQADTAHEITATDSDGTLPSLIALANDIRTNLLGHFATLPGTHPGGADTGTTIDAPSATDLDSVIALANAERAATWKHFRAMPVHDSPGDWTAGSRITAPACWDAPSAAALLNNIKAAVNHHRGVTTISANYHAAADHDNAVVPVSVVDITSLCGALNELADRLGAHCTNLNWTDKSSASYHRARDLGGSMDGIPRARDDQSAAILFDSCWRVFLRHISHTNSQSWHNGAEANPGAWYVDPFGVSALEKIWGDTLANISAAGLANMMGTIVAAKSMAAFFNA